MYRTFLAQSVADIINNTTPVMWPGTLKLGSSGLQVQVGLDPFSNSEDGIPVTPNIVIVPGYVQFSNPGRNAPRAPRERFISLVLSVRLQEQQTDASLLDTLKRSEWEPWLNLKDDLDKFLYEYDYSSLKLRIETFEPEPPDEYQKAQRFYYETTVIGYVGC